MKTQNDNRALVSDAVRSSIIGTGAFLYVTSGAARRSNDARMRHNHRVSALVFRSLGVSDHLGWPEIDHLECPYIESILNKKDNKARSLKQSLDSLLNSLVSSYDSEELPYGKF